MIIYYYRIGNSERGIKRGQLQEISAAEIMRMKKGKPDVCILAHAYQGQEILEVADLLWGILIGLRAAGSNE